MAASAEITQLKLELEELYEEIEQVADALEGPCPICGRDCDPNGRMCHRGRMYFFGSAMKRPGVDPGMGGDFGGPRNAWPGSW